jgi:hypothetical protein
VFPFLRQSFRCYGNGNALNVFPFPRFGFLYSRVCLWSQRSCQKTVGRSVTANISWYVVSEKWHHFRELPHTNLLGLFEVAGENNIFGILAATDRSPPPGRRG